MVDMSHSQLSQALHTTQAAIADYMEQPRHDLELMETEEMTHSAEDEYER